MDVQMGENTNTPPRAQNEDLVSWVNIGSVERDVGAGESHRVESGARSGE
jgi:hypothetical protein